MSLRCASRTRSASLMRFPTPRRRFSVESPSIHALSSTGDSVIIPKITVLNEQKKEIEVPAGTNLRIALRQADVQVYSSVDKYLNCRGLGLCGTCAVLVKDGMGHLSK